ncbi:type IX secretion system membrane protein PorP/SprF [Ichthyenterobacterium sp. W332]|uniref:Type IX secretion system membrane protein PorP/SprF n=1 Tax=Microcosmobacter mediterraneus TaxID=3075607 RepID=A0ABU2YN22_9FLAO|nr:type IX secretion system membrane protein PorP/SprF [Ichthyenterobacterium sp. W332]MDT0559563.1 type IX secretion system membrane protein PorP/SprF [Ichthyenterobacterium sp. W332]
MINTKHILLFILFNIIIVMKIDAQQDAQYTQYMYNMNVINPAYATDDKDNINFGLLYRSQWVGAVGAPNTVSFFAHSTIAEKLEGGLSIVHDQIGDVVKDTNLFFDLNYVFPVSEKAKLSLGIKAGLSFFSTNFNGFVYSDPLPDPAFAENLNRIFPNIGTGAFYFTDRFYLGFSIPNLLQSKHLDDNSGIVTEGSEALHMFTTGGYVFNINENIKLKPAFMAKSVVGAPLTLDLTSNVLLNDKLEFGLAYRINDGISGLFNLRISDSVRLGYAYDYTVSNLGRFNSGTHEVMFLFDLSKSGKGYDKSPRFF